MTAKYFGYPYRNGKFITIKFSDGMIVDYMPYPEDLETFNNTADGEMLQGQQCKLYFAEDFNFVMLDFGKAE